MNSGNLSKREFDKLACTYATLLLHDADCPITAVQIQKLLKASNIQVDPYWPILFTKTLKSVNMGQVLSSPVSVSSSAPVSAGPDAKVKEVKKEEKNEEKKEEKKEEPVELGMGNLFGDD